MIRHDLRIEDALYEAIQQEAADAQRSVNAEIVWRLRGSFNHVVTPARRRRIEGGEPLGGGEPEVTAAIPPGDVQAATSTHPGRASSSPPSGKGSGEAGAGTSSAVAEPSERLRVSSPGKCPMQVPVGVKCKVCGKVHQPKGRAA
jgi:hypothetical protein